MTPRKETLNIYHLVKEVETWNDVLGLDKSSGKLELDLYPLQKNYNLSDEVCYQSLCRVVKMIEILGYSTDKILSYYHCEYDYRYKLTKSYKTRYELISDLVVIHNQQQNLKQGIIFVSFSHFSSFIEIADFSEFSKFSPEDFWEIPITKLEV